MITGIFTALVGLAILIMIAIHEKRTFKTTLHTYVTFIGATLLLSGVVFSVKSIKYGDEPVQIKTPVTLLEKGTYELVDVLGMQDSVNALRVPTSVIRKFKMLVYGENEVKIEATMSSINLYELLDNPVVTRFYTIKDNELIDSSGKACIALSNKSGKIGLDDTTHSIFPYFVKTLMDDRIKHVRYWLIKIPEKN